METLIPAAFYANCPPRPKIDFSPVDGKIDPTPIAAVSDRPAVDGAEWTEGRGQAKGIADDVGRWEFGLFRAGPSVAS